VDVTVREGGALTDVTVREGVASGGLHLNLVPGGVFLSYRLVKPLEVTSGEADLWFIAKGDTQFVLKLYRYGIKPKAAMTEKLQALAAKHVVRMLEHGTFGNRAYEVLEKIEHGDLRQMGKPCPPERLREVLRELGGAVGHLHEAGVIHRDLKPANILMRSVEPLDLVLTDFGIASLGGQADLHLTNANRTASYSAPEALTGVVSAGSDWWSVGVMVLELLKGVHPFAGMSEQVINFQLVSKGIVLPGDLLPEWSELLKGLLTRDHEKRWRWEQVEKWLDGARNQATHYEGDRQETHTHKPYQFGGRNIYTARDLAVALSEDWEGGVKDFGRGFVAGWVRSELRSLDLSARLFDLHEDQSLSPDEKLTLALGEMDPELPGVWKGNVVNREWAAREPEAFLQMLQSKLREKLEQKEGWPGEVVQKLDGLGKAGFGEEERNALGRVMLTGNPSLKLGEWEVTPETLAKAPEKAIALLEGKVPGLYAELTGQTRLSDAAARWQKYWPRVEALGCGTSKEKALPWIIGPTEQLTARATELVGRYVGSKEPAVQVLWERGDWATAQCVALCVADEAQLLTESEKPLWEDLQWVKGVLGQPSQEEMQQAEKLLRQNDWDALAGILAEVRDPTSQEIVRQHPVLGGIVDKEAHTLREAVALCVYVQGAEFKSQEKQALDEVAITKAKKQKQRALVVGFAAMVGVGSLFGILKYRAKESARVASELIKSRQLEWKKSSMRRAGFDEGRITRTLTQGGTVVAWMENDDLETTVPVAAQSGVTAIAAGNSFTLALKNDGTVVAWGRAGIAGQLKVPAGLSGVVAVAAGDHHAVALKNNGTVVAWGSEGSYNDGTPRNKGQATTPSGLSGVVAIAAGGYYTVALKSDGTVVAWGDNTYGQTNVPSGLSGVVDIVAGNYVTMALKSDGTVVAWGFEKNDQTKVPTGLNGVVAGAVTDSRIIAIKSDGTFVQWGKPGKDPLKVPADLSGLASVASLYQRHGTPAQFIALKRDGTLLGWWKSDWSSRPTLEMKIPVSLSNVVAVVWDMRASFPALHALRLD
jgi:hypothetical protein